MTTKTRLAIVVAVLAAGAPASAGGARRVSAAALLANARQLLVVTTSDWNTVTGTLTVYERPAAGDWAPARPPAGEKLPAGGIAIVVGKNGTAWDASFTGPLAGPIKAEGDGRSPAGVFSLGTAFGFAPAADARWLKWPYAEITPTLECVDDPASGHYNTLVDRASPAVEVDWKSSEKMREIAPAYHWGVVVEHNTAPAVPGRGSCVFLHIGGSGGRGTAGCTAMDETALRTVMRWLDPDASPVLVQMPVEAYARLRSAWNLPALPAARGR